MGPLLSALHAKQTETIKKLLKNPNPLTIKELFGEQEHDWIVDTPLSCAIRQQNPELIELLLNALREEMLRLKKAASAEAANWQEKAQLEFEQVVALLTTNYWHPGCAAILVRFLREEFLGQPTENQIHVFDQDSLFKVFARKALAEKDKNNALFGELCSQLAETLFCFLDLLPVEKQSKERSQALLFFTLSDNPATNWMAKDCWRNLYGLSRDKHYFLDDSFVKAEQNIHHSTPFSSMEEGAGLLESLYLHFFDQTTEDDKNLKKALRNYLQSDDIKVLQVHAANSQKAILWLGMVFYQGYELLQDPRYFRKTLDFFKSAAEKYQCPRALVALNEIYTKLTTPNLENIPNISESQKVAFSDELMPFVAMRYELGIETKIDIAKAIEILAAALNKTTKHANKLALQAYIQLARIAKSHRAARIVLARYDLKRKDFKAVVERLFIEPNCPKDFVYPLEELQFFSQPEVIRALAKIKPDNIVKILCKNFKFLASSTNLFDLAKDGFPQELVSIDAVLNILDELRLVFPDRITLSKYALYRLTHTPEIILNSPAWLEKIIAQKKESLELAIKSRIFSNIDSAKETLYAIQIPYFILQLALPQQPSRHLQNALQSIPEEILNSITATILDKKKIPFYTEENIRRVKRRILLFYHFDLKSKEAVDFFFEERNSLPREFIIVLLRKNLGDNPREFLTRLITTELELDTNNTLTQIIVTTPELGCHLDFNFLTQFFNGQLVRHHQEQHPYLGAFLRAVSGPTLKFPLTQSATATVQQCALINHLENKIKAAQQGELLPLESIDLLYQHCNNAQIIYSLGKAHTPHLLASLIDCEAKKVTLPIDRHFILLALQTPSLSSQLNFNYLLGFFSNAHNKQVLNFAKFREMLLSTEQRSMLKPEYILILISLPRMREQLSSQQFIEIFNDALSNLSKTQNLSIVLKKLIAFEKNQADTEKLAIKILHKDDLRKHLDLDYLLKFFIQPKVFIHLSWQQQIDFLSYCFAQGKDLFLNLPTATEAIKILIRNFLFHYVIRGEGLTYYLKFKNNFDHYPWILPLFESELQKLLNPNCIEQMSDIANSCLIFIFVHRITLGTEQLISLLSKADLARVDRTLCFYSQKYPTLENNVRCARKMIALYQQINNQQRPSTADVELVEDILQASLPQVPDSKYENNQVNFAPHKKWVEEKYQQLDEFVSTCAKSGMSTKMHYQWQGVIRRGMVTALDKSLSKLTTQAYLTGMTFLRDSVVFRHRKGLIGSTNTEQLANSFIVENFDNQREAIQQSTMLSSSEKVYALLEQSKLRLKAGIAIGKVSNSWFRQLIEEKIKMKKITKLEQLQQRLQQTEPVAKHLAHEWFSPIYTAVKDTKGWFGRNKTTVELEECLTITCSAERNFLKNLAGDLNTWLPQILLESNKVQHQGLTKEYAALANVIAKIQPLAATTPESIHSAYNRAIAIIKEALLALKIKPADELVTAEQVQQAYTDIRAQYLVPPKSCHAEVLSGQPISRLALTV